MCTVRHGLASHKYDVLPSQFSSLTPSHLVEKGMMVQGEKVEDNVGWW